jgi:predicted esterase
MIREWIIFNTIEKPRNCIVALPGRGIQASTMLEFCKDFGLEETLLIVLRPFNWAWYPQPNSSLDQKAAVNGLGRAKNNIEEALATIKKGWGFKKEQITLLGFSAGAVMSLYTAMHSKLSFASAVSLGGAIFEPEKVPQCKHPITKILLCHNQDDDCFNWFERYLPMKKSLSDNGYDVTVRERSRGGHWLSKLDVINVSNFLGPILGYGEDWEHPGFLQE